MIWGQCGGRFAARIGGDTVVLAGNAVYETDESISGSAYVLGGHMSRMGRTNEGRGHRMSVGPVFFWLLAAVLVLDSFIGFDCATSPAAGGGGFFGGVSVGRKRAKADPRRG